MKKYLVHTFFLASALFGATICTTSCGGGGNNTPEVEEKKLVLSETSKDLIYGDVFELIATYQTVEGNTLEWLSSDTDVATVDGGTIHAVGVGEATITAMYGVDVAKCNVKVTFGDYLPTLSIKNISDTNVGIAINNTLTIEGEVFFNGNYYPCDTTVTSSDEAVVKYENKKLVGLKKGSAIVTVNGSWHGFTGSTLCKTLTVNVTNDVVMYNTVTIDGEDTVAHDVQLSIVGEFKGQTYPSTAKVVGHCTFNGEPKDVTLTYDHNGVIEVDDQGIVTCLKIGNAKVYSEYKDEDGVTYKAETNFNVICPVESYSDNIRLCSEANFPVADIFGEGATIVYAKQGNTELTVKRGKFLEGLVANGDKSGTLEIQTTKGGYLFTNPFIYTRVLTADNMFDSLKLSETEGRIITGYYILEDDIDEVDMTGQSKSTYAAGSSQNTYFAGTFDGQGHTVNAKVGHHGVFGGLGDGAVIKNTHFNFEFIHASAGSTSCGLAKNEATYTQTSWTATLNNLYITAENYDEDCYSVFDIKFLHTIMKDIYVDISNTGFKDLTYTSADQEIGYLFHADYVLMNGPQSSFTGDYENVYIVTGTDKLMPAADTKSGEVIYVNYTYNDRTKIGPYTNFQNQPNAGVRIAIWNEGQDNRAYFGNIPGNTNGGPNVCWIYEASGSYAPWQIANYKDNAELKKAYGKDKIGDWPIKVE